MRFNTSEALNGHVSAGAGLWDITRRTEVLLVAGCLGELLTEARASQRRMSRRQGGTWTTWRPCYMRAGGQLFNGTWLRSQTSADKVS